MAIIRRLKADNAELYLGGVKVGDAYDLNITFTSENYDSRAWGQKWTNRESGIADWKATAKSFRSTGAATLASGLINQVTSETPIRLIAYRGPGATNRVFESDCFFAEASTALPKSGLQDDGASFENANGDGPIFVAPTGV
jgi:hypothetical protein